jgi:hypothetical protein
MDVVEEYYLLLRRGELSIDHIRALPPLINTRLQVKSSGIKERVIFMVDTIRQTMGNDFRIRFYECLKDFSDSEIFIGRTQQEISAHVVRTSNLYKLNIDFSNWDWTLNNTVMVLSFNLIESTLKLKGQDLVIFRHLRNLSINSGFYHPSVGLVVKKSGQPSGDTFTSAVGSCCNWIVNYVCLFRYCKIKGIDFWSEIVICKFCGDDADISTSFEIDNVLYFHLLKTVFNIDATLESKSSPDEDKTVFLGSEWIGGVPYRPKSRVLMQLLFGSGNIPSAMSNNDYVHFLSRAIDIFGNSGDCEQNIRQCGINIEDIPIGLRLFSNNEHFPNPHSCRPDMGSFESRGYYYTITRDLRSGLNNLWKSR